MTISQEEKQQRETWDKINSKLAVVLNGTGFELFSYEDHETFEGLEESLQEQITQEEVIYYANAMDYLRENDCSLKESNILAHDMGYSAVDITSELLATLLTQANLMTELAELTSELEECFEEDEEEKEPQDRYNEDDPRLTDR